jgi:hypothetical protein
VKAGRFSIGFGDAYRALGTGEGSSTRLTFDFGFGP